jgi:hypothetical protein
LKVEPKVDWEPESYAGYGFLRDRARGTFTVHMAKKIEEMALKYLPGIKDGMTFKDLDLPSGAKLAELANALKVEESEGPLTAEQKMNQSILGDLKWVERVVLKLCLLNHRMSCVSTRSGATFN